MFEQFKTLLDPEDPATVWIETPDGLRLIFRNETYVGWYLPGGEGES